MMQISMQMETQSLMHHLTSSIEVFFWKDLGLFCSAGLFLYINYQTDCMIFLRTRVSRETDDEKQSALRQRFIKQYTVWDQLRRTHLPVMPEDCSYHDNGDDQNQLPHIIYPSSYSNSERSRLHLQNLVDLELQLRSGQLVDIIGDLRLVIRRKALLLHYRKTKSVNSGKAVWTRSQVRINNITHEVETLCQIYNDSQRRFQSLRATSSNVSDRGVEFPPMKPEDLMLAGVVHYLHVGRGYDKISWIWKVLKSAASAEDDDNWNTEGKIQICSKSLNNKLILFGVVQLTKLIGSRFVPDGIDGTRR